MNRVMSCEGWAANWTQEATAEYPPAAAGKLRR
jgi:hypothetical protein